MGCNCGKNRVKPIGSSGTSSTSKQRTVQMPTLEKPKGTTQSYTLTRNGTVQTFGSRLEAESARVRGGGGIVRPT